MRKHVPWLLVTAVLGAACGARIAAPLALAPDAGPPAGHPFLPLEPGTVWTYVGEDDGEPYVERIVALESVAWSDGTSCVPLVEERRVGGDVVETTTEWFAVDDAGNVWQFGEESWQRGPGGWVLGADAWRAGEGSAVPVPFLPAVPVAGDEFVLRLPHGDETRRIVATDAVASTPFGDFDECLEVHENPDDPDHDVMLYAPGTGLAAQRAQNGYKLLVDVQRPR